MRQGQQKKPLAPDPDSAVGQLLRLTRPAAGRLWASYTFCTWSCRREQARSCISDTSNPFFRTGPRGGQGTKRNKKTAVLTKPDFPGLPAGDGEWEQYAPQNEAKRSSARRY